MIPTEMPSPPLSTVAAILRPFAKAVFRLHSERQAGRVPISRTDLPADLLNDTLKRLRGPNIDDSWWRRILLHFSQRYVSPDFLQKPALQEWLADQQVAADFKELAINRILLGADGPEEPKARLVTYYSDFTGEAHYLADGPIEVVTAVLVAGYVASIPPDQRALAGISQAGFQNISDRFDRLEDGLRDTTVDPIAQEAHTQRTNAELISILRMTTFDIARSRTKVRALLMRTRDGDLIACDNKIKTKVVYWAARLYATETSTLHMARELRDELVDGVPETELTIVDALMALTTGRSDQALRLVRDLHDPDARTVMFGAIRTTKGEDAALAWVDQEDSRDDSRFFSGPGWVNWAICSVKLGRWERTAKRLQRLYPLWHECPMLSYIEGTINAAMLLPEEFRRTTLDGAPLFRGMTSVHGVLTSDSHTRATYCFKYVQEAIDGVDIDVVGRVRDWMLWLRVMDPMETNSQSARSEIADRMSNGPDAAALVVFATIFEIPYDAQPLREYLDRRRGTGGLDDTEILADFLLLRESADPRDIIAYIEMNRKHLSKIVHPTFLIDVELGALAQDGQLHRARKLLTERTTEVGEEYAARLGVFLNAVEGHDPRSELEQLYRSTKSIIDLHALVSHLKLVRDIDSLYPLLVELFRRERTAANALDVVTALTESSAYDYSEVVHFLELNRDLLPRLDDLNAAYGWALFHAGRIGDAKRINDNLVRRRADLYDSLLAINIAIVSGDWDHVTVVVDREWPRRDSHDGKTLMHLASLASGRVSDPDRVLALAQLATKKAPDDARILSAAFWLYCKLGQERAADPEWLNRAADLSTTDEGPLWRFDLTDVVERWLPRRQELVREVERKWLGGEIPLAVAAATFNVSLARMLWHIPRNNDVLLDGRKRLSIPIMSGERSPLKMQKRWKIGLDVTSVMVLQYLGLLQQTIDAFDEIRLSPDVMELLFLERDEVLFHQPSLVVAAKEVRALQHAGSIALAEDGVHPSRGLIDEVGLEIASLLCLAKQEDGVVVCVLPIHKSGSWTESANLGSLDRLVLSTVDVCASVYEAGRMDSDVYQRTMQILAGRGQERLRKTTRPINDRPVYITDGALSYLQDANILRTVTESLPRVLIHTSVDKTARDLIEESDHSYHIQAWIDGIRGQLVGAMNNGTLSLLPRRPNHGIPQSVGLGWRSATSLLMSAESCDALCVDDRCLNRHAYIDTSSGEPVPVVCTVDILRHLLSLGTITNAEHWTARHRLRRGGLSYVPIDPEEILYWLSCSRLVDGEVVETAELRVLRQSVAHTTLSSYLTDAEATTLSANHTNACKATIELIWQDTSVPVEQATAFSNWLWQNLSVAGVSDAREESGAPPEDSVRRAFVVRLAILLLPIPVPSENRRNQFTRWVEQSVFSRLQLANAVTVEQAVDMVCDSIVSLSDSKKIYGNWFFAQLPPSARWDAIGRHTKLAEQCGFTLVRRFQIANDIDIAGEDLLGAIRRAFSNGSEEAIKNTSGRDVSVALDSKTGEIVLQFNRGAEMVNTTLPEMNILSPIKATRREAVRRIVDKVGATGPGFLYASCNVVDRTPTDDEVDSVLSELVNGVAARWFRIRSLFDHRASVSVGDIVPNDLSYYERFCGPAPCNQEPDAYIRDTLVPHRMKLIERDLSTGIDISVYGALRDDLCPGKWLIDANDDDVWRALDRHRRSNNPFVLIAAIDVAAYRQKDSRFQEFIADAMSGLSNTMSNKETADNLQTIMASLCDFLFSRINLVNGCAARPGYWKRMCAWMQAGQIVDALAQSSASIDTSALRRWIDCNVGAAGVFAGFVDLRNEPMLSPARRTWDVWKDEIAGRLCLLKGRHEEAGREIPGWDRMSKELGAAVCQWERGALRFPGPLEGHRIPAESVPQRLADELDAAWEENPDNALRGMVNISLHFRASGTALERTRAQVVDMRSREVDAGSLDRLECASYVAARSRDVALAREVGRAAVGMASKLANREHTLRLYFIILTAAAAHERYDNWGEWLDNTLTSVARCIPDTPSGSLRAFRECLDQVGSFVAMGSWFHLQASAVASSGF